MIDCLYRTMAPPFGLPIGDVAHVSSREIASTPSNEVDGINPIEDCIASRFGKMNLSGSVPVRGRWGRHYDKCVPFRSDQVLSESLNFITW